MQKEGRVFDHDQFLDQFYRDPHGHTDEQVESRKEEWACQAFNIIPESESCLDVGCGPVLNVAACASRKCKNIYLSDYNTDCFIHITHELTKDTLKQPSFWLPRLKVIAKLENVEVSEVEQRLRDRVAACFKCDLTTDRIVDVPYLQKVDVIATSLALESVGKNVDDYRRMLANLKRLLKKQGYIYIFGVLQVNFYKVKQQRLPALYINQEDIKKSLTSNNFEIIKFNKFWYDKPCSVVSDAKGYFSVLAKSLD